MKYNKNEVTGKMRDRIILQNVNRSRSLTGFASESWADTATIWAFAESKLPGSNETIIDGKNTAKNVCDFTIRYISTITEESRVVWGDKLYQVKNLKVSHDRRFISFQGIFYDSYVLTGVNVAASVTGIATTSANLKLIMSVIGQANAIASTFGDLTVFQQGVVEVAASVNALGNTSANLTKVISISGDLAGSAFVEANASIVQNISASVNADANVSANLKLTKTLVSSVNATATATSILDVVTQGFVSLDASVTATGEITANLLRIATLTSSPSTAADTSAIATLTKVLEATATATAETSASAQLTIPVNATATATAETSANAQLSYTVNAEATATAETSAEAQIVRIISASATATAESSAEASFGVTFAANVQGTANVDNATIARAATMIGSVTGQANVTGATLTTVDNVAASVSGSATVSATLDVGGQLLLDLYPGATAAYSLRKLRTAYSGNAIRVRRSSDNTEQNIGFDSNGNLNESALTTFVGANNGFVVTWYDQSGNARNATQSTQANQSRIVNAGTVELLNSKPCINTFAADTKKVYNTSYSNLINRPLSIFLAFKNDTLPSSAVTFNIGGSAAVGGGGRFESSTSGNEFGLVARNMVPISVAQSKGNLVHVIQSGFFKSNSLLQRLNGVDSSEVTFTSGTPLALASNFAIINTENTTGFNAAKRFQETIIYESDQSSNRIAIETNINTYYGIY